MPLTLMKMQTLAKRLGSFGAALLLGGSNLMWHVQIAHGDSIPGAAPGNPPAKPAGPGKPKLALSIQPRHVTDALRAVIQSDREVYMRVLADLESSTNRLASPEGVTRLAPAPCAALRRGSEAVASRGVEYSYVLRALQPINPRNRPETEVETKGLQFVGKRPDLVYTSEELLGGRWYFTAVYPDAATVQGCADCHNQQRSKERAAFKKGDVIGALVIRIALEL